VNAPSTAQRTWLALVIVAAAAVLAFAPCLRNSYTNYDDFFLIVDNPLTRDLSWRGLARIFGDFGRDVSYLPLTLASFAVERRFFGTDPAVTHLVNVLLHALNSCLAFWVMRRYGLRPAAATGAALLFATHPLQTEAVAWASQRKEVLSAAFAFAALGAYAARAERGLSRAYVTALALYVAAILAKPMALALPLGLLAADLRFGRKIGPGMFLEKIPFCLAWLIGLSTLLRRQALLENGDAAAWALTDRLAAAGHLLAFYAQKLILPVRLSCLYPSLVWPEPGPFWRILGLASVVAAAAVLFGLRKDRAALFGGLLFLILLSPAFPFSPSANRAPADRFFYLPSLGLFLAFGALGQRWAGAGNGRRRTAALLAVAGAVALAWVFVSRDRCADWRDSLTLWRDTAAKQPGVAPLALFKRGESYLETGDPEQARRDYERALREGYPRPWRVHNNIGWSYALQGRPAEAIAWYRKALESVPAEPVILRNLALARKAVEEENSRTSRDML